jgi:DNA mismatch repair protein MutS
VLHLLEESERAQSRSHIIDDLPLFSVPVARPATPSTGGPSKLLEKLEDTLPDDLSPREALELVYQLKKLAVSDDKG